MLQTIREIGIFMIVAQAIVHFAPGKQYEKYVKSISGVIVLLLFLKPFVEMAGGQWQTPSAVFERLEESVGMSDFPAASGVTSESAVEAAVVRRMEEEIADRLNRDLAGDPCLVKQVELTLPEAECLGGEAVFSVMIVMGEQAAVGGEIMVEEITVGASRMKEDETLEAYRLRFAGLLEWEEDRVEVRWDGRD
ncbi:MAG: stage III sporulation protein AF [Lachnospiraceae bacterium]|nr:stage III sporulation protein AF [Lachnospiraceae bacterium]